VAEWYLTWRSCIFFISPSVILYSVAVLPSLVYRVCLGLVIRPAMLYENHALKNRKIPKIPLCAATGCQNLNQMTKIARVWWSLKLAFHDADTNTDSPDTPIYILTCDTRDFLARVPGVGVVECGLSRLVKHDRHNRPRFQRTVAQQ